MKSETNIQEKTLQNQNDNFCRFDTVVGLPTINLNEITLGDSLELCERIPAKTVDLILEDMPYNVTQNEWEYEMDLGLYWKTRLRMLKPTGVMILTASQPFASKLLLSNLTMYRYDLIWYKALGTGFLNANRMPMRNHEHILIFYNKLPTYNPLMTIGKMRTKGSKKGNTTTNYGDYEGRQKVDNKYYPQSVIDITNGDRTSENDHPTQKPVGLFEYLIRTYTNEGDLVFDGFGGSGTTAVACHKSKRNFIVIEKEKKYFDLATRRLANERTQLSLL